MTAVRVTYFVGLVVFCFGGVRALEFVDTHQTVQLVSGLVIAALGAALLAVAAVRYRQLRGSEQRPIYGNAKQSGVVGIIVATVLAMLGGVAVWAAFTPDIGPKALPIAVLFFAMAAWSVLDARRKLREVGPTVTQTAGGGLGG